MFYFEGYVKVNWQQLSEDCAAAAGKTKDSLTKQGKVILTFDPSLIFDRSQ